MSAASGSRVASYLIGLESDPASVLASFSKITSGFRSAVGDLKSASDKLDLFSTITDNVPKVQQALDKAKANVKQFADEIDKIKGRGEKPTKELTDGLKEAEKAAASAGKELARQQQQLATLDSALTKAGVNTKQLASEQIRLAEASKVAADAASVMAAKQALGLTTLKDIAPEVTRLRAAFDALKASGTASAGEIAIAEGLLNAKIKELNATVSQSGSAFKGITDAKASLTGLIAPALAAIAVFGSIGSAIAAVIAANKEFDGGLKQIAQSTTITKTELATLGQGVRELAVEIGINLGDALRGVKELIRGGLAPDEALVALKVSAEAAKAAMVDLGTGVAASKVLLQGFGIPVSELSRSLDVLNVAAKNGGPTLAEFASSTSNLGVVAQAVNADFNEVIAALTLMTRATGNASESAAVLQKILVNLNSDEVQKKLRDLGIAGLGVAETFAKLDEKGLNVNQFLALGVANSKAAAGVASLKNEAKDLPRLADEFGKAVGQNARDAEKLFNSLFEKQERFNAALKESEVKARTSTTTLGVFYELATNAVKAIDRMDAEALSPTGEGFFLGFITAFLRVEDESKKAREAVTAFRTAADEDARLADASVARTAAAQVAAIQKEQAALSTLRSDSAELLTLIDKLRAAGADSLSEIATRAAAEIEAITRATEVRKASLLEQQEGIARLRASEAEGAAQAANAAITAQIGMREAIARSEDEILRVRIKATQDSLAVIKASEAQISTALTEAYKARLAETIGNTEERKKIEQDYAKLQVDNTQKALSLYRAHYSGLTQLSREYIDKIKSIESERVGFNKTIQDAVTEIRNRSLTGIDAYQAKILQIEDSIGRAQTARLNGSRELEKTYTNEAISGARSLGEVVDKNGKIVVTAQKAQADAFTLLDKVSDQFNDSLGEQETSAKKGAKAAQDGLNSVKPIIDELQGKLDKLNKIFADGITVKVNKDIEGLKDAEDALNKLARERVARLKVELVGPTTKVDENPIFPGDIQNVGPSVPAGKFNRGGSVWRQYAQQLAAGGSVFRAPSWSKVPGSGNGDTVPALLPVGSFVMRRAASEKYGDGVMSMLARGYAGGSYVGPTGNYAGPGGGYSGPNDAYRSFPKTDPTGPPQSITTPDVTPLPSANDAYAYARGIAAYLRPFGPLQNLKEGIGKLLNQLNRNPRSASLIQETIRSARIAAANNHLENYWMASSMGGGAFQTFKDLPDWYDFIAQKSTGQGFARGGPVGTDSVPAWLTPREWVLNPPAVQRIAKMFGGGFLPAMNAAKLDPRAVSRSIAPPPMPRYFAQGGPVGPMSPSTWSGGGSARMGGDIYLTVNAAGGNLDDPAHQRRIAYALKEQLRRAGK